MLELLIMEGANPGQTIRLTFEKAWFGRQTTCDFVLQGDGISRVHFSIERRGDEYILVDNKSTNGTYVNRVRTVAVTLKPGYDIVAGSNRMQVREVADRTEFPYRFVANRTGGESGVQLVERDSVLLGRKSICPIQLNDPAVDAVHAELEHRADGVWITDESSGAGVYVNGQRIVQQQLFDGDVITIRPFEIAVTLTEEACLLGIQDLEADAAPSEDLPENYRDVAAPPVRPPVGQANPSAAIASLPRWMQAKAPIWVPTSDIVPNRVRSTALVICLVGVLGWTAIAFAEKWKSVYSPGPLTTAHATASCELCHSSFGRVPDTNCQGCHSDKAPTSIHASNKVSCAACHSEHRGAKFDIARNVGAGCQAVGCHVTVHVAQKNLLAHQAPPEPGLKVPPAVSLAVHFEAGDAMHDKHAKLKADCAACHTGGDPTLVTANPAQPAARAKELKEMRGRCLACHAFGPDATLRDRCYSCHLEHHTEKAEIITTLRFPPASHAEIKPGVNSDSGLMIFFAAMAMVPLYLLVTSAGGLSINYVRSRTLVRKKIESSPPIGSKSGMMAASRIIEPKSTDNQAPGGNLRPRIDLDLCVGCGACVHVCPFNVLEIVNEKAIAARLGDCTGYAACAAECPTEAITLVSGGAMQTVELPVYDDNLETNVPGLFLAGEVTGKALIKVAINQGKKVMESIARNLVTGAAPYDVIVVGAGPAGTSAALAAKGAGLNVVILEQGTQANTIRNYPRQKFVMAEPVMIPLYGPLWMEDTSKEALLDRWNQIIQATGLTIQENEKVHRVIQTADHFVVESSKGAYRGARVVLAIGKRGSPRKLGVPGEELSKVAYNLLDADAYRGQNICIVGGGDSGIEAANGLARPDLENRVWLVHRMESCALAKPRNQKKIHKSMEDGRVTAFFNSGVTEIRERSVVVETPQGIVEIENDYVFVMVGGENPKKFLNDCGIEFNQRPLG